MMPHKDMNFLNDNKKTNSGRMLRKDYLKHDIDIVLITDYSNTDSSVTICDTKVEKYHANSIELSIETLNIVKSFLQRVDQDLGFEEHYIDNSDLSLSFESESATFTTTEFDKNDMQKMKGFQVLRDESLSITHSSSCGDDLIILETSVKNNKDNKRRRSVRQRTIHTIKNDCRRLCHMCALDGHPCCPLFV